MRGWRTRNSPRSAAWSGVSYCMDCGGEAIEACQYDSRGSSRIATGYVFPEDRPSLRVQLPLPGGGLQLYGAGVRG